MVDRYIQETELPTPNEACLEDIFLPLDYKPTREDVICSRGSISYHHVSEIALLLLRVPTNSVEGSRTLSVW